MESTLILIGVTAALFGVFYLVYRRNKTSLASGFTFTLFLGSGSLCYVLIAAQYPENPFLFYPLIAAVVLLLFFALFGLYALLAFLLFNARTVFKREGRSLANSLTLLAAVAIVAFMIVSAIMAGENLPLWARAIWAGIISVVTVYTLHIAMFLMTALLCALARPRKMQDYIIVLGSGLIDGRVTPLLAARIDRALKFARKQEAKRESCPTLIMSGGQGADEPRPEAEAMREFAIARGFDPDRILVETASTSTAENMAFSKAIMDARSPEGYRAIYATSAYHVMRAGVFARRAGLRIDGIGAPTAWYYVPNALLREYIALIVLHKRRFVIAVAAIFFISALTYAGPLYVMRYLLGT